jgi:amino acid adenylation domain-containing protein
MAKVMPSSLKRSHTRVSEGASLWLTPFDNALQLNAIRAALLPEIAFELHIPIHNIHPDSNFVRNGGDSLSAIRIVSSCRSKGLNISTSMLFTSISIDDLVHQIASVVRTQLQCTRPAQKRPRLVEYRSCQATSTQLSFLHGSESHRGRNNIRYYESYNTKDITVVKRAWKTIVITEPIFRTRFQQEDDKHILVESEKAPFVWEETTCHDREEYMSSIERDNVIGDTPGTAFTIYHLEKDGEAKESTVIWHIHHAFIDGYSKVLLLNKHRRLLAGYTIIPAPSFCILADQLAALSHVRQSDSQSFWIEQQKRLQTSNCELQLPSPKESFDSEYACKSINAEVDMNTLRQFAQHSGVTVASIFYAAWALTLSHYVDSDDVSFGVVLSGRSLPLPNSGDVVGPLINTVPFHISMSRQCSITEYLGSVFNHSVKLDEYQWTIPESVRTVFPSTLNIQFESQLSDPSPLELLGEPHYKVESALPLNMNIDLMNGSIQLLYHSQKFYSADIERLGKIFSNKIQKLVKPNATVVECLDSLPVHDNTWLWTNGNCTSTLTTEGAWNESLVDLYTEIATGQPQLIAVEKGSSKLTYDELHTLSTSLAIQLRHRITPGEVVCVLADRSIYWIIAIFGILKAGGIYCPLDESLSTHIRDQNFCQSGSRILLTGETDSKILKPSTCELLVSVDELLAQAIPYDNNLPLHSPAPDAGAYLCFSSGSTGKPKGILCTHRSLVAFQSDFTVRLMSRPGWRVAQTMSPAFDGSIHEIFSALTYGSTLVLRNSNDPFGHLSTVDTTILTPSIARVLQPKDYPSLSALYLVGEAVPQDVSDKWASRMPTFNMYGPTEATCGATIKQLLPGQDVTLGRPNPTTRIYVLSNQCKLVPPGVIGEIYLAGVQVANGYIKRPQLTQSRFILDSVNPASQSGARMYRTGDRGYWNSEGELCFAGRNDRQIKLRGFRVDLDDIEFRIQAAVRGCTAVALTCHVDYLVAHLQPETLQVSTIEKTLKDVLPIFAVPRHIAVLTELPLTTAGKLDYQLLQKSLPETPPISIKSREQTSNSQLLRKVSDTWKEVLAVPGLTIHEDSNFSDLGGHSLLQLQLANKLSTLLGYQVPLKYIIQTSSLGELVNQLQGPQVPKFIDSSSTPETSLVSPIEESWWKKYEYGGGSSSFNVSLAFQLGIGIDIRILTKAWNTILERYQILRCRYERNHTGNIIRVLSETPPKLQEVSHIDTQAAVNQPFYLTEGSLMRVLLSPTTLLIVASHIICDYTSLNVILDDVSREYHGLPLSEPRQYTTSTTAILESQLQNLPFWKTYLHDPPQSSYSIGNWGPRITYSGSSHISRISADTFHNLHRYTRTHKITPHQLSLAAVALALQHHGEAIDITLGAPFSGRDSSDRQDIVGLFLEPLPIRIRYPFPSSSTMQQQSGTEFVHTVRSASQSALCHAVPIAALLDYLSIPATAPDNSIFDVMVSYHENFGSLCMSGIDAKPAFTWTEGAKFKLMVEFFVANDGALMLRVEYSDECFDKGDAEVVRELIEKALEGLVAGKGIEEIRGELANSRLDKKDVVMNDGKEFFGMPFAEI